MSMLRLLFVLLAVLFATGTVSAQRAIYVAPDGSVLGSGNVGSPVNSVATALVRATAGDTIYVRGGTYTPGAVIRINKSGAEGQYLHIWAYPGETPVFDFTGANRGFEIRADYIHMKGLVVEKALDNGILVKQASHNIIEQVVARWNGDSGVQVEDASAHNLLLNIDSYENYDPTNNGENADGFAIKFGVGPGNVVRGCRAWGNSDDGYDFWSVDHPNQQGILLENNWAFRNGYNVWDDPNFQGDSNGFKLGHGPGAHVLIGNLAWGHRAHGFDVNGNISGVTLYHNTAYQNRGVNFNFDDDRNVTELGTYVLRNNVSLGASVRMDATVTDHQYNSWNSSIDRASAIDFLSLDDTGADGPRLPDGSLPVLDFLRLAPGSDLIDAGIDVGLPFSGAAPDLGAYEFEQEDTAVETEHVSRGALRLVGPNPVRHSTRLAVEPTGGAARVEVFDALGRHVTTLLDAPLVSSSEVLTFDASGLAPGLYVVQLQAERRVETVLVTVVR